MEINRAGVFSFLFYAFRKGNGLRGHGSDSLSIFAGTSSCLNGYQDMKFKVKCLYQNDTLISPEELRRAPSFVGDLLLMVKDDVAKGSITLEARLVNATQLDLLPSLSDIKLVSSENGDMLVRGHYDKPEHGLPRKQAWFLLPVVEY